MMTGKGGYQLIDVKMHILSRFLLLTVEDIVLISLNFMMPVS